MADVKTDNVYFIRAALLAEGETMTIRYELDDYTRGEITLSRNVKWLSWKTQNKLKRVLSDISSHVVTSFVQ